MSWRELKKISETHSQIGAMPVNLIVMNRSDHYPAAYFRSSLFILVLTFLAVYYIPYDIQDPIWLMALMIPALFLGHLLALIPRYKRLFVASSEMKEECYQQALEMGYQHGLLANSKAIFIFVSLFERRVEMLVPEGSEHLVETRALKNNFKGLLKTLKKTKNPEIAFDEFLKESVKGNEVSEVKEVTEVQNEVTSAPYNLPEESKEPKETKDETKPSSEEP